VLHPGGIHFIGGIEILPYPVQGFAEDVRIDQTYADEKRCGADQERHSQKARNQF
jgi:hypothetical protein